MQTTESSGSKRGYKGLPLEGPLARWYAKVTRKDLEEFRRLAGSLADRVGPGSVLEVAPGPGYLSIELARRLGPGRVTGLDISRSFIGMAGESARQAGVSVDFRHGNAAAMPLDPDSFDLIVCRAAFKNFSEPVRALDEMHRVLKPGGEALIIDLRGDARPADVDSHVDGMGLAFLDRLMTKLIFRGLIRSAYTAGQFRSMAESSRFGGCTIESSPIGLEVTLRK